MRRLLRSAWVIARRDYVATVFSRTFLLFLIGPLLPALFGVIFGAVTTFDDLGGAPPPVIAIAGAQDGTALLAARARLVARLGHDQIPPLKVVAPPADPRRLIDSDAQPAAVLSGDLADPVLTGPDAHALKRPMALLIDEARQAQALGARMPAPVRLTVHHAISAGEPASDSRRGVARGAQIGLFLLIAILTSMLISNLVEEKSSKVIEVLAAAVPVDAIFAGKLIGMLAVSLTGIAAWATIGGVAAVSLLPPGAIATPAVGWPAFVLLALIYFAALYLLVGAVYLGIGAQAGSAREVQMLSLPLTMAHLLFYGLSTASVAHPDRAPGIVAMILPWSSPYAMLARAAQRPEYWPHAIALLWQAACFVVVIRVASQLFRLTVLKSGGFRFRRA